jgi:hypothetical protein
LHAAGVAARRIPSENRTGRDSVIPARCGLVLNSASSGSRQGEADGSGQIFVKSDLMHSTQALKISSKEVEKSDDFFNLIAKSLVMNVIPAGA